MKARILGALRAVLTVATISAAVFVVAAPVQSARAQSRMLPDFPDLVEQVGPSVVNIRTSEKVVARAQQGGPSEEEMLDLFRRFGLPIPNIPKQAPKKSQPQQPQEEEQPKGVGSGFILSSDGLIMTNAHVVDGATEVLVTLTDKREFKAKIIGADLRSDIALVKIEATGLPAVKVGDVSKLRVGEWVMAIGSPFGLENSVTAGIVSAKLRDTGDYLPFIQTDVAINPGNSGGPLINMRGEVIGVNSQIYSRSGGYMGISFAIPMDEAVRVSDQLRSTGRVTRGRMGVQIDQVSKEVAESIGLGKSMGALVRSVEAGSPAERGGIEAGDIITKFDGRSIEKSSDLPRLVGATKPGTRSTVTVFRRGATRELSVVVAELEADKAVAAKAPAKEEKPKASLAAQTFGLVVAELSEAQKKELGIKGGVRVEAATDAAARGGLREGDVIIQVGNVDVSSVKEFDAVVGKFDKSKGMSVLFRRAEWTQYAVLKASK
ncbi:serine peptidase [Rhodoferax lacus]|uniref:Probable periplasmic serine endoprotease DegP-like n=1 Tax=Rhodoferax lacus TaxID=2184758 RepID=A0A3E1R882_9BURK|nr:Do family serine endopeptidase [Rhodoferax lacus]RFO95527.1 serine peptidase [Rhodoferax lacus]